MKGLSLFSGAGIGETYLAECGIDIVVANEILPKRANLYRSIFPSCNMICGDITNKEIFNSVITSAKGVDFIIASPPCQGMSVAGKHRNEDSMLTDSRSFVSYPRHEYFRRILCAQIGTLVENGEYPDDIETLAEIVMDICYNNTKNYFGFDLK